MLFVMQAVWKEDQPAEISRFPAACRLMQTLFERPVVQRIFHQHQIEHLMKL
jgi:hypothetical protein